MKENKFNNPKLIQGLCIGLGFLFFGLGALGATMPVLPTTPFLLLAAFFFARGNKRFHDWFTKTGLYKTYLESYMERRAMTRKTKFVILFYATVMMIVGIIMVGNLHARLFIGFCILFMHWYFVFRIRTIPAEEAERKDQKPELAREGALGVQVEAEALPASTRLAVDDALGDKAI